MRSAVPSVSTYVQCPHCFNQEPLTPPHIKPAQSLVLKLLGDVVHCVLCSRGRKASGYHGLTCEFSPTYEEMRSVAPIGRAASFIPDWCLCEIVCIIVLIKYLNLYYLKTLSCSTFIHHFGTPAERYLFQLL